MKLLPPDAPKRTKNIERHGYDMADLTLEFFETAHSGREKAVGLFEGEFIAVIFKRYGSEALRAISMRRARRKERKRTDD